MVNGLLNILENNRDVCQGIFKIPFIARSITMAMINWRLYKKLNYNRRGLQQTQSAERRLEIKCSLHCSTTQSVIVVVLVFVASHI